MRYQVFVWLVVILISGVANAAEKLVAVMSAPAPYHTSNNDGFADMVMLDVFGRAGFDLALIPGRPLRALKNVTSGQNDTLIGAKYCCSEIPELVRVPEPFYQDALVSVVMDGTMAINDWAGLREYHVGHLQDWVAVTSNLPKKTNATVLKTAGQLFKMLKSGRIEVAVSSRDLAEVWIKELNLRTTKILTPALLEIEVFIYVNKRHEGIVPSLDAALKGIKADGTYDRLMRNLFLNEK